MSTCVHIAMSDTRKRTLILGAGFSGIVSLKSALEADLGDVVCYEQSYCIGGLWKYREVTNVDIYFILKLFTKYV